MSQIALINGCVLFPNSPDWRSPVEYDQEWSTRVARTSTGVEKRSSFRGSSLETLSFSVYPSSPAAQHWAQARLLKATQAGKIAVPFWGQGQPLAASFSNGDSSLTLNGNEYPFSYGDLVIFPSHGLDDEDYVYGVVNSLVGDVMTLTSLSSSSFSFLEGEMIYPLFFGRPELGQWTPRTIFHSPFKIKVVQPLPTGQLGEATNNTEITYATTVTDRICDQTPEIWLTSACGGSAYINWLPVFGATSYNVYSSSTEVGGYTLFDHTSDFNYPVGRPYLEDKYWRVTALIGDVESDPSNAILVEGAYIERTMRALQERNFIALGTYIDWPDHDISATDPGHYPSNGFYDDDIAAGGAAREVVLIQAIADAFSHSMLYHYTSLTSLENRTPGAALPRYSDGSVTFYAPFTSLPLTVLEANRESSLNALVELICILENLIVPMEWHEKFIKQGIDLGPRATPGEASSVALAAFNAATYYAATAPVGLSAAILDTPGFSPYWVADYRSVKGVRKADLTRHGVCRLLYYLAMDPTIGGSPNYAPFSILSGNNPPVDDDGLLHIYISGTGPSGIYYAPELGAGVPETPSPNSTSGWEFLDDGLLVLKSSESDSGEWNYYP